MRQIANISQLRSRPAGQPFGTYIDTFGQARNDWNELVDNTRYIHNAGIVVCNKCGANDQPFTETSETERFYPVDLQPGYRNGRLMIRLWPFFFESIAIKIYRNGSAQTLRQYYSSGVTGPDGGTALPTTPTSGPVIRYFDFDLDKSLRSRFNQLERGYLSIQRNFNSFTPTGIAPLYGVYALQLKQFNK